MDFGRVIFALLFLFSVLFFLFNLYRLFAILCLGKWENRFDHLLSRLKDLLVYGFGQKRVVQKGYGINHFLIFWGFILLLIVNAEFLIAGLFPKFSFAFLGTWLYGSILYIADIISLVVIVAVVVAVIRRLFFRPEHIEANPDAFLILAMIASLMIAYFGCHAGEIRLGETEWSSWMPISSLVAHTLSSWSDSAVHLFERTCWWIHAIVLLAFMNYLPYSKHLHVITALPNCFFRSPEIVKTLPTLHFELGESFGVSTITQFTWKQLLDFMSCTECGRCQEGCPAYQTGKTLNPKHIVHQGKVNLFTNAKPLITSKAMDSLGVLPDSYEFQAPLMGEGEWSIAERDLWDCTTCGACMVNCPVFIEHVPEILEMRRHLVMEESRFPQELNGFFVNSEQRFNPWGLAPTDRAKWAENLDVKILDEEETVEYLFFVGCSGAYDTRSRNIVTAIANIFNKAGISWGILGNEERCCGDSLRRLGNEYVFEMMAKENIAQFNKHKIKKIVTHCPHGYSTLKNDYRQFGGEFEVLHHSELILQLIQENKIKLNPKTNETTVFHDSCYLGRYNNIYDDPRDIVRHSCGGTPPREMERTREKSFCCGAGGGRMWLEESTGKRIYQERTQEALKQNPSTIAVACPFCITMFEDGVKHEGVQNEVMVKDIAEIVDEVME